MDLTDDVTDDLAFAYFPGHYRWSHGLLMGLGAAPWGGAEIGEVHRIGLRLRDRVGDDAAWFEEWAAEAATVERWGRERLAAGHGRSAAAALLRAAHYLHVGERFVTPKTPRSQEAYLRGVRCFADAAPLLRRPRVESVEIPYEGTSLPGLWVAPEREGPGPAPAMLYLDGLDITKEMQFFRGAGELAARGIGCLVLDGPGNGEAIRFRDLPLHAETERYATPAWEWLAARPDVDAERIGVMGISLGGYYAPRAAAFEPRFACAVAWGAQWDYAHTWAERLAAIDADRDPSLSVPWVHLLWVLGVASREDAARALEAFRLDGVAQRIRCPFLLVHGEGDQQIPLADARRCFEAVGSRDKELRVFTRDEGGHHHCQIDNLSHGVAAVADWVADVLRPGA